MNKFIRYEIIICSIVVLCCVLIVVFSGGKIALADTLELPDVKDFNTSNVVDDLHSSTVDGEQFDVNNYTFDEDGDVTFFGFAEYCYSDYSSDNYELYFYVYNPAEVDFDRYNTLNNICLAIGDVDDLQSDSYVKCDISFVNSSSDILGNLFLKFKVANSFSIWYELTNDNSEERIYNLASFELMTKGDSIVDYGIANTYTYTGYVEGHSSSGDDDNLTWDTDTLNVLNLDVQSTWYRTGVSNLGINYQNQINSVYFSVSDTYLDELGYLSNVFCKWNEVSTDYIVCLESDYYSTYSSYIGSSNALSSYNSDIGTIGILNYSASDYFYDSYHYDWVFNMPDSSTFTLYNTDYEMTYFPYLFDAGYDCYDFVLSNDDLINYIYAYPTVTDNTYNIGGVDVSKDLFTGSYEYVEFDVDIDEKVTIDSFANSGTLKNKFWSFLYPDSVFDESYTNLSPIVEYTPGMSDVLVDDSDLSDLASYYVSAKSNGETTYLVRYAVSDYYKEVLDGDIGYIAQQTAYLNFDIITLTFTKDAIDTVVPVVANPIAIQLGDVDPPEEYDPTIGDGFDWETILSIILCVVILMIIAPFLPTIINIIISVVNVIIKIIVWPFKAIAKAIKNSNK